MCQARRSLAFADSHRQMHPPERSGVWPSGAARISSFLFKQRLSPRSSNPAARRAGNLLLAFVALLLLMAGALPARSAAAQSPIFSVANLETELTSREAQLIAAVNVERQIAGLLPLRWNRNMSEAARWFARDAVLNGPICGHTDSLGRGTGTRLRAFGYSNIDTWGQAIVCGFTEPHAAVAAWMYGGEARAALLNPNAREAGAGYFYSQELSRGFVVLDVAADPTFAPVVINNEAVSTSSAQVTLALHPQISPSVAMKISNTPDFDAVAWEPFATQKSWVLEAGTGWRTVYVLLRCENNQTQFLSDTIYLGDSLDNAEISLSQATNIGTAFGASGLPATMPSVRLSLDWSYDSGDPTFIIYRGPQHVDVDATAIGGSALRMLGSDQPGLARGTLTTLPVEKMLTAYFRIKLSNNQGGAEVARLSVRADGREFGPLVLRASDFAQPEQYQEFGLDFAFPAPAASTQVEVQVERTGAADVVVDAVRFYGQPISAQNTIVWTTGSSTFRQQGVLARAQSDAGVGAPFYMVGAPVDAASEMPAPVPTLVASPTLLLFRSAANVVVPANAAVAVCSGWCENATWQAAANAPWLVVTPSYEGVIVRANPTGLAKGVYETTITITPGPGVNAASSSVQVQLVVDGDAPLAPVNPIAATAHVYLPVTARP